MRKFLFPACLALVFLCQCEKEAEPEAVLPDITTEGKNTMGFTIDNKVWLPYQECCNYVVACTEISAYYNLPIGTANRILFDFTRVNKSKVSSLRIQSTDDGSITSTGDKIDSITVMYIDEKAERYITPRPGSKFVVTRIDPINKIISGEFEFILKDQNSQTKEVQLKAGRFDFKFPTQKCR